MGNRTDLYTRLISIALVVSVGFKLVLLSNLSGQKADVQGGLPGRAEWRQSSKEESSRLSRKSRLTTADKKLWEENSTNLPQWLREYFEWHHQVRQTLSPENWEEQNYLLVRCVPADKHCAGASDRLKAIPGYLRMAYNAEKRRFLVMTWLRPAPLEEFLVPPVGGMNWTVPSWLGEKLNVTRRGPKFWMQQDSDKARWPGLNDTIVRMKNLRGSDYYESFVQPGEPSFDEAYYDIWRVMFEPSPAVAAIVSQQLEKFGLIPKQYVAAHVRSLYVASTEDDREEVAAINCVMEIGPGLPVFVATDSHKTTSYALEYGRSKNLTMYSYDSGHEPLHLDRGRSFLDNSNDWKSHSAEEYYDVFVDLFLLANSRCIAYGVGGYGVWATLLGRNRECSVNHREAPCGMK